MTAHALQRRATGSRAPLAALAVGFLVCFALLPVEIGSAFDLPFHPLILHVPVILNPVLALVSLALVAKPEWRRRYGLAWGAFAVVALASTVLTAGAGEAFLEGRRVVPDVLHEHAEAADVLRVAMFVFTALILATVAVDTLGGPPVAATVLVALVALAALTSGFFTIRTGHLGAKAAWGQEEGER